MYKHIVVAALLAAATPVHGRELAPYGGESIELGSIRGVTYYTEEPTGYRVVTTLADGEAGLPLRFEATLADQQRLVISVPGKLGGQSTVLEVLRAGDKLILSRPQALKGGLAVPGTHVAGD
jgi:hypothetical protein